MKIRQIDVHDDALLTRYHEVADRAERFERPWESMWSLDEMRVGFRGNDPGERMEAYAAFDGERLTGTAFAAFTLLDNTDKAFVHVGVEPELRGRGIGSALVDLMVSRCAEEGRSTMVGESSYPFDRRADHPTLLWARKNGFSVANTEIHRVLDLPVPAETLQAIAAECAPHHAAYRIETYVDDIPEAHLESYCYLLNQLGLDAPAGDFDWEEEALTPKIFLQRTERMKSVGRQRYSSVAVDESGVVVAHTDLILPREEKTRALQWGTLVRRDHRGHRLGAAVKAANLQAVQADQPERTDVHTTNAEVNAHMVDINDRLGFRPVALCPGFQRKL
jgi:GNAT superfamily N-acetyltransferase